MKDYSEKALRARRPEINVLFTIEFCLSRLFADNNHNIDDSIVSLKN